MFINGSSFNAMYKLHAFDNFIMVFFSTVNFTWMRRQMGIHKTDVRFINLHTYTDTAFVALHWCHLCVCKVARQRNTESFLLKVTFRSNITSFNLLAFQIDFSEKYICRLWKNNDDTIKLSAPVPTVCVEYLIFLSNSWRTNNVNIMPTKRTDTNSS